LTSKPSIVAPNGEKATTTLARAVCTINYWVRQCAIGVSRARTLRGSPTSASFLQSSHSSESQDEMSSSWLLVALLAAVILYAIVLFNRLVRQRNQVREGWSGIDVQLRRRTDLVPNLVETVQAYAAHERGLFEQVAKTRAASIAADNVPGQAQAERALGGALHRLFALAEGYPALKADQNFHKLQEQLAEIEDQLQMARRYYNGAVRNLNITIQSFPSVLVARPLGFREEPFFELDDDESAAPQVAFRAG
jgi:LemA protein